MVWLNLRVYPAAEKQERAEILAGADREARRLAALLAADIALGRTQEDTRARFQVSLGATPATEAGFVCLLDSADSVLCHPERKVVGSTLANFDRTAIVAQAPVEGTGWRVAVHVGGRKGEEAALAMPSRLNREAGMLIGLMAVTGGAAVWPLSSRWRRRTVRAEEKFRRFLENLPTAVLLCDAGDRVLFANAEARRLFAESGGADILGSRAGELWSRIEEPRGGGSGRAPEIAVPMGRGNVPRRAVLHSRRLEDGGCEDTVHVLADVTDLRLAQREFYQAQKSEAIGRLASGVAHDFNNLISVIQGFADLARGRAGEDDPTTAGYLDKIVKSCARATALTRQVLALGRRQKLQVRSVDLGAALADMEPILTQAAGAGVRLEVRADDVLWPVMLDPAQLEQVLLNLVINARDAMDEAGGVTITVQNWPGDSAHCTASVCRLTDCVRLEIADTGPGISDEARARLFEPFFTTKSEGKGSGLGLASAKGIVEQHGGHLELAPPRPGVGAVFHLYFPRRLADAPAASAPQQVALST